MRPSSVLLALGGLTFVAASPTLLSPRNASSTSSSNPPAFFLAGDSTTATQSSGGGGWGNGFLATLKAPAFGVNQGHNGATTVSFVQGGDWDEVLGNVREYVGMGGWRAFVTIQFGHNDQKDTANISLAEYQTNLENLANDVRSAGGTPLLLTPLTRRTFTSSHNASDSLHDQRLATLAAGAATSPPTTVLDLNQASLQYVDAIGETAAHAYNLDESDDTHLDAWGSVVFGRMVADLMLGMEPVVVVGGEACGEDGGEGVEGLGEWVVRNETMSGEIWCGLPA